MNPPDTRQCTKVMLARVQCTKTNRPLSAQTPFQFKTLQRKNGQFPEFFRVNGAKTTPTDAMNVPERPRLHGGSLLQGQKGLQSRRGLDVQIRGRRQTGTNGRQNGRIVRFCGNHGLPNRFQQNEPQYTRTDLFVVAHQFQVTCGR